jgi:hypothetical protein
MTEDQRRDIWLTIGLVLAPTTWLTLLVCAYWAVPGAHEPGRQWMLRALHGGAALIAIASLIICLREVKQSVGDGNDMVVQRRRFMALAGVAITAISLLVILGMAVPTFLLWPGAEP